MLFNQIALMFCLVLMSVTKAAALAAARRGDSRQRLVFHFLRLGLSLSACSYLFRLLSPVPGSLYAVLGFFFCFAGTLLIWIGWMEHWSLHRARAAQRAGESDTGGVSETALPGGVDLPCMNASTQRVLRRAQEEARGRRQDGVDTDHLLLGLLEEPSSAGADILGRLHVRPEDIHLALGPPAVLGRRASLPDQTGAAEALPLTDRARRSLSLAAQEAHRFDKAFVGTDHLLLGLVLMGTGAAASVLFQEGVTVEGVRNEVLQNRMRDKTP